MMKSKRREIKDHVHRPLKIGTLLQILKCVQFWFRKDSHSHSTYNWSPTKSNTRKKCHPHRDVRISKLSPSTNPKSDDDIHYFSSSSQETKFESPNRSLKKFTKKKKEFFAKPKLSIQPKRATPSKATKAKGPCQACRDTADPCMRKAFNWPFASDYVFKHSDGRNYVVLMQQVWIKV